ncbi:MAG: BLUF domain-containing protein, partial [Nitrosomonadaceae bacterium]|nr:BLUF domain-containing protein [Nitrosomonadaceae bacterium]
MSNLIHLIYNSAAACAFTEEDFSVMLRKARSKNASLDITGMLLYIEGCFFQVLEGPENAVNALAEAIRQDPRHTRMTTIIREPIVKRAFSEWTMGFTQISLKDLNEIQGLNVFFTTGNVLTDIDSGRAKKLLIA